MGQSFGPVYYSGLVLVLLCSAALISATVDPDDDSYMHPIPRKRLNANQAPVEDAEFWIEHAQEALRKKLAIKPIEAIAKNVIFYLGDGMSVPTITAARIFKGQKVDGLPFGEEAELYMDTLPHTGTSKEAGKSTGIVTTTRITHASPAGAYAHIANRFWENDEAVRSEGGDPDVCEDIAKQLIRREPGTNINVILGGGRRQFLQTTDTDPESSQKGYRQDENLISAWMSLKNGTNSAYVWAKDRLLSLNTTKTDYLLGLFAPSHLGYLDEQERDNDPSLEDMTRIAIEILSKNPNGFFLFVEGGRIDHGHHDNQVQRSLWETIEFDKSIKRGDEMTNDEDTLIVVTADHAHVMHIAGYPHRGNPILEFSSETIAQDGLNYATLGYANGPGQSWIDDSTGRRHDISGDNFNSLTYQTPSPVPLSSETHGGDDVLIMSRGPYAHLLTGVQQQSYIPHVIGYAACIGNGAQHCETFKS